MGSLCDIQGHRPTCPAPYLQQLWLILKRYGRLLGSCPSITVPGVGGGQNWSFHPTERGLRLTDRAEWGLGPTRLPLTAYHIPPKIWAQDKARPGPSSKELTSQGKRKGPHCPCPDPDSPEQSRFVALVCFLLYLLLPRSPQSWLTLWPRLLPTTLFSGLPPQ